MEMSDYFPGTSYTLADLTVTETGIDNTPDDDQAVENLTSLAQMLANLYSDIGAFQVNSAYRNAAVNQNVGGAEGSAHNLGLAADIIPTTMSITEWFSRLLNSQYPRALGEMFIKPTQGSIHLSLPLPNKVNFAGILDPQTKEYRRFAADERQWYENYQNDSSAPPPSSLHLPGFAVQVADQAFAVAQQNVFPIALFFGIGAAAFFAYAVFTAARPALARA